MNNHPPRKTARLIAIAALSLGAAMMLAGVTLTVISAWIVWHRIDAAGDAPDAHNSADTISLFSSMNHMAGISVGVFVTGLVVVIVSLRVLPRNKAARDKTPSP